MFKDDLVKRLKEFNSAPILFVGAGMSRRYLDTPGWEDLLRGLADKTGKDYAYYRSRADGKYPEIASSLVEPLSDLLWTAEYETLRGGRKDDLLYKDSALKIFAAERIREANYTKDPDLLEELKLLGTAVVDAIITTNYDEMLEGVFDEFQVYVGQDELVFSDPKGVGEIYKIHGSIDVPNSLVLTRNDYDIFAERNAYLAAKLLTLFAEHPVIFLGYSMSDENIIQILKSLVNCLKPEHVSKLQNRLFFVQRAKGGKGSTITTTILPISQGVNIPVVSIEVLDFKDVYSALGELERKFSAHILRRLKERVYELVLNNDPQGQLYVTDLEGNGDGPDVVIGVGAIASIGERGYVGMSRSELIADVLHDDRSFDAEKIVLTALPDMFSRPGNFPFIKYMLKGGFIDSDGSLLREDELNIKVIQRFGEGAAHLLPSVSVVRKANQLARQAGDFKTLSETNELKDVLLALGALPIDKVDVNALRDFLITHEKESTVDGNPETAFAKAVALYDRLKYYPVDPWAK